jgi:hypothetical protein
VRMHVEGSCSTTRWWCCIFVTAASRHLAAVAAFRAEIALLRKAGLDQPLADSEDVVTSAGVVSTTAAEDSVPEQFFDDFASALAKHRGWDRETDSVPPDRYEPSLTSATGRANSRKGCEDLGVRR